MRASAGPRLLLFGLAAGLWLVAAAVKWWIRPAVGLHAPEPALLVLGSTPSLLAALSVPLFFLAVHPKPRLRDVRRACMWALAIVLVAEMLERELQGSTFDYFDLTASIVGVAVGALMSWALFREGGYGHARSDT